MTSTVTGTKTVFILDPFTLDGDELELASFVGQKVVVHGTISPLNAQILHVTSIVPAAAG